MIIHQPRMAANGDAAAGGRKIRFGGDGVLIVAQIVADIGEDLDQGQPQIRRMALRPVRHDEGQPVQDELPEGGVVFGEIVDLRFGPLFGRAGDVIPAVQRADGCGMEGKVQAGIARVQAAQWPVCVRFHEAQGIGREVPHPADRDAQAIVAVRAIRGDRDHLQGADVPNAMPTVNADVPQPDAFGNSPEQRHGKDVAVVADLQVVQSVGPFLTHGLAPPIVLTDKCGVHVVKSC